MMIPDNLKRGESISIDDEGREHRLVSCVHERGHGTGMGEEPGVTTLSFDTGLVLKRDDWSEAWTRAHEPWPTPEQEDVEQRLQALEDIARRLLPTALEVEVP